LEEVIETLFSATWHAVPKSGLQQEVAQVVRMVALEQLLSLAMDPQSSVMVRSIATAEIQKQKRSIADPYALSLIAKFQEDPKELNLPKPIEAPPGQPIGSDDESFWPF
jgi:hypothetical protein